MIRGLLTTLGRRWKGEVFAIDPAVPTAALVAFAAARLAAAARGLRLRPWLARGSAGPLFVGTGVRIRARGRLALGRGVTIGRGVAIDALSRDGVRLGRGSRSGRTRSSRRRG